MLKGSILPHLLVVLCLHGCVRTARGLELGCYGQWVCGGVGSRTRESEDEAVNKDLMALVSSNSRPLRKPFELKQTQ
jgi:hypothetical protein